MHILGSLLRAGALCALLLLGNTLAEAQGPPACDQFAWPLAQERAWFAAADIAVLQSGSTAPAFPDKALVLDLRPTDSVAFPLPPGGKAKAPNTFGGAISFAGIPTAGLYQVTLSDEGWIDVIQDGRALHAEAHTGKRDCPGVRKSVRFHLSAAPTVIQLSGVAAATIRIAIRPAE